MAYRRIQAARAAARHPEVLDHLESGDLSLSTVRTIAPHLDRFGAELVEAARGMSDREAKRLVAELVAQPVASYCKMQPLAGGKVKIEIVVDAEVADGIEEAVAIDRHLDPSGDRSALMDRMVRSYLKQRKKERYSVTDKPRSACSSEGESRELARRTVPAQVSREVIERDGERCSYVSPDGTRCSETGFLEFDHRQPVALGGRADDVAQVRILCRAHNQYEADRAYGANYMDHRRAEARSGPTPDPALEQAAADITTALHQMGFTKTQSRKAVESAMNKTQAPTSRACFARPW